MYDTLVKVKIDNADDFHLLCIIYPVVSKCVVCSVRPGGGERETALQSLTLSRLDTCVFRVLHRT